MSEKRFWFVINKGKLDYVQDNVTGENITVTELEDLLNEMSETIVEQQSFIGRELLKFDKYLAERLIEKEEIIKEQETIITKLKKENEQLRRLFEEMKQPITINLTEEDEKELRKLLGLIDDE